MCSPVGHSLLALGVGALQGKSGAGRCWFAFCLFAGIAPDLDILIGWAMGDINAYHRLGSHSLFAALLFAAITWSTITVLSPGFPDRSRWTRTGFSIYCSHILLDLVTFDGSEPVGMQLMWPFSDAFYTAHFMIFPAFRHDTVGGDMLLMIRSMTGPENLRTVAVELVVLVPILLFCLFRRRQGTRAAGETPS